MKNIINKIKDYLHLNPYKGGYFTSDGRTKATQQVKKNIGETVISWIEKGKRKDLYFSVCLDSVHYDLRISKITPKYKYCLALAKNRKEFRKFLNDNPPRENYKLIYCSPTSVRGGCDVELLTIGNYWENKNFLEMATVLTYSLTYKCMQTLEYNKIMNKYDELYCINDLSN